MIQNIVAQSDLINDALKAELTKIFSKLTDDVVLKAVVDMNDSKGKELAGFLATISTLSEKITLQAYDSSEVGADELDRAYLPVVGVYKNDTYSGICFHGVPGGKEINPFVLALYNVGGPGQELPKAQLKAIQKINKKINLKVCVSLACAYCAQEVAYCQRIASLNENVEAEMIDATLYKDLIEKYKIERIPLLIVNDEKTFVGQKDLGQVLDIISTIR